MFEYFDFPQLRAYDMKGDQTTIINAEKTTETRDGVTTGSTEGTTHDNGYMTNDDGYVETSTITQHAQNENTKIPIAWIATTVTTVTDYLEVVLIVLVTIIYSGRQLLEIIQRNPLMPPLPLPPAQPVLQPNPPAQPVQQPNPPAQPVQQPNPPAQPVQQPNHPVQQHRQRRALQPIPQIRRGQRVRRRPDRFQIYEL
ncbi:unnamed protein product [Mytilus coruscus]|uniref:Uncharacterized protein n=1 Tax=Mytilus coruscus TaxID=42192 RepID=A0A6J8CQ03_MYTCO|nr:unnamed protein product [Mytilus coruscus]